MTSLFQGYSEESNESIGLIKINTEEKKVEGERIWWSSDRWRKNVHPRPSQEAQSRIR